MSVSRHCFLTLNLALAVGCSGSRTSPPVTPVQAASPLTATPASIPRSAYGRSDTDLVEPSPADSALLAADTAAELKVAAD
jgi:hypothetical protein